MPYIKYPTQKYLRQCFRYKNGRLFWKKRPLNHFKSARDCNSANANFAGREAGNYDFNHHGGSRCTVYVGGKKYYRYHLIWIIIKGTYVKEIDHINHNSLDDRIVNLREADRSLNNANQRKHRDGSSIYKGVSFCKITNKWVARICKDGNQYVIGRFATALQASVAYTRESKKLFGKYAYGGKW